MAVRCSVPRALLYLYGTGHARVLKMDGVRPPEAGPEDDPDRAVGLSASAFQALSEPRRVPLYTPRDRCLGRFGQSSSLYEPRVANTSWRTSSGARPSRSGRQSRKLSGPAKAAQYSL